MRVILSCLLFIIIGLKSDEDMKLFVRVVENLSTADIVILNKLIDEVTVSNTSIARACHGTLLMKKADFVKRPSEKLSLFKEGRKLLETEIKKDSANVNFRILRLIIQENCPVFLKYNTNLDDDAVYVQRNFDKLSNKIRDLLITYSKNSKHLKLKESD